MFYNPRPVEASQKEGGRILKLSLTGLLLVAAIFLAVKFAPEYYYRLIGDPLVRLKNHAEELKKKLASGELSDAQLYEIISEDRKVIAFVEREKSSAPEVYFYRGLYYFYEFIIRVKPDSTSLINLVGREIIPDQSYIENIPARSLKSIARKMAINMRKASAIDPTFKNRYETMLVTMYGDLFYFARTDPIQFQLLQKLKDAKIETPFLSHYEWLALALYSIGKKEQDVKRETELIRNRAKTDKNLKYSGITISPSEQTLLQAVTSYRARNYIVALRLLREIQENEEASLLCRIEALRLQGEVFLVQRRVNARPYFKQALELAEGRDELVKMRLKELEEESK